VIVEPLRPPTALSIAGSLPGARTNFPTAVGAMPAARIFSMVPISAVGTDIVTEAQPVKKIEATQIAVHRNEGTKKLNLSFIEHPYLKAGSADKLNKTLLTICFVIAYTASAGLSAFTALGGAADAPIVV
jgi:hypothetical protein